MKKSLLFLLLPLFCFGQQFMDSDNQWVYKRLSMTDVSYFHYSWGNDTIINGNDFKKLEVILIQFVGYPDGGELTRLDDVSLNPFFINIEDDIVQYYDIEENEFHNMFVLNAEIGDQITMKFSSLYPCGDLDYQEQYQNSEVQTVTSIGTSNISGHDLSYYTLEEQAYWAIVSDTDRIYNNIGGSGSLFPTPSWNCDVLDNNLGYPESIVCFSNDNMILSFEPTERIACTELLSTTEYDVNSSKKNDIRIVPNPVKSNFKIIANDELYDEIEVYSVEGKRLGFVKKNGNEVNFERFIDGVYFLKFKVKHSKEVRTSKVIKSSQ